MYASRITDQYPAWGIASSDAGQYRPAPTGLCGSGSQGSQLDHRPLASKDHASRAAGQYGSLGLCHGAVVAGSQDMCECWIALGSKAYRAREVTPCILIMF